MNLLAPGDVVVVNDKITFGDNNDDFDVTVEDLIYHGVSSGDELTVLEVSDLVLEDDGCLSRMTVNFEYSNGQMRNSDVVVYADDTRWYNEDGDASVDYTDDFAELELEIEAEEKLGTVKSKRDTAILLGRI